MSGALFQFRHTEHADAVGRAMTPMAFPGLVREYFAQSKRTASVFNGGSLQEQADAAHRLQLLREAIEAFLESHKTFAICSLSDRGHGAQGDPATQETEPVHATAAADPLAAIAGPVKNDLPAVAHTGGPAVAIHGVETSLGRISLLPEIGCA